MKIREDVPAFSQTWTNVYSNMNTLRIVVAGCGGMSETWIKTALGLPHVEVVGFVDVV